MKKQRQLYKTNTALTILLFLMYSLVPASYWIADMMGYKLVLKNSIAWAVTVLSIGGITTILMFIFTWKKIYKVGGVCAGLSILITQANWYVYGLMDTSAMLIVAFTFVFGAMIFIRFAWPVALKTICAAIAILLLPILTFFSLTAFIFDANVDTVVESVDSPNGQKYVEVVDESKAEGSKYTVVNVYEKNSDIDMGLMLFEKKPVQISNTKVDEFTKTDVSWIDDKTLSLNGKEYSVE